MVTNIDPWRMFTVFGIISLLLDVQASLQLVLALPDSLPNVLHASSLKLWNVELTKGVATLACKRYRRNTSFTRCVARHQNLYLLYKKQGMCGVSDIAARGR